jgi:hypothetical protein
MSRSQRNKRPCHAPQKKAQITLRVESDLKEAAGRAAAQERRSLTSWIERILATHLRSRRVLTGARPKEAARTALKLAVREIDAVNDKSLPPEERERRKRNLLRGPGEFRDIRCDQAKSRG